MGYYSPDILLPIMNENILKFFEDYRKVTYSDVCIQSVKREKCGKFCIVFVKSVRCKQPSFDFVDLASNDILIENIHLSK